MLEIIGTFVSKFFTVFKDLAGVLAAKVLATLGLSYVSYLTVLPEVKAFVQGYFNQMPPEIMAVSTAINFDIFIVMILSALVVQGGSRAVLTSISNIPATP